MLAPAVLKVTYMSNVKCEVDPWDMLNNFGFHVYAQKSLFIAENRNGFFTPSPVPLPFEFIELVPTFQLKWLTIIYQKEVLSDY